MKKSRRKTYANVIILTLCFTLFFAMPDVQAVYNNDLSGISYTVNLKRDQPWLEVSLEHNKNNRNAPYTLVMENLDAGIKARISNISNVSLNDINSRDQYIEIVTSSSPKKRLTIYRWNGKKPVVYASAVLTPELTKLSKKNYCYAPGNYVFDFESNGKGRLTIRAAMVIRNVPCILDLNYKVANGTIQFDSSSYAIVDKGMVMRESQKSKAWHVYKYPRVSSNKAVFTLKKGEKIRTLKLKITSQYTFMQVKRLKDNKTGWVVFRTKDIDAGNRTYNPYK